MSEETHPRPATPPEEASVEGPPPSSEASADTAGEEHREATPFANTPAAAEIPQDTESPEFSEALQALKPLFASRTEYNFMVCDQLAARGVSPNGLNVRKAGSWGAPSAIGSDVKAWYIALSVRLSNDQAKIPEAAKRSANHLVEQLWTLATQTVVEPYEQEARATKQELADAHEKHKRQTDAWERELHNAQVRETVLAQEVEASEGLSDTLRAENERLTEHLASADESIVGLNRSIAEKALEHQKSLAELDRVHAAELAKLREESQARQDAMQKRLDEIEKALSKEREQRDSDGRQHMLAIDRFQVDLREANKRADKAQSGVESARAIVDELKDQLSTAAAARGNLDRELAILQADSLQFHRVMGLLRQLKLEHGQCEPRDARACTRCNAADDLEALVQEYRGARAIPAQAPDS